MKDRFIIALHTQKNPSRNIDGQTATMQFEDKQQVYTIDSLLAYETDCTNAISTSDRN